MSSNVTIAIPAFNEEQAIGDVVRELKKTVPDYEILVINDGSADATSGRAREAGATVIEHEVNKGYGASLATGIRAAKTEYVVFIDADGQHNPQDVVRLVAESGNCDMVVGARTNKSHVDAKRILGKKILRWFANYLAKEKIPDINSGFRVFRRDVIIRYLHLMPSGFSFSTTSTFAMLKGGRRIKWVSIETRKRVGTSTVRQLKHGPQTMMLMLRLTVLFDPLRVFFPLSVMLFMLAFAMVVVNFIFFRFAVPATAVFLGISSLLIFLMGLLTDQISAIRREIHEKE